MNTNVIENLSTELSGVKDELYLLSIQFGKNDGCQPDNFTISGTLHAIAAHVGRISDDLDAAAV